ncbi:MAG: hypothetical protein K6B28_12070 [Lachnospiraceae bacterium]|nr:hypothetical protein [Lachnospiraceae bacterium]
MKMKGIMGRIAVTFVMTGMILQSLLPATVYAQDSGSELGKELLINGGAEEHIDEHPVYGWVEPYTELGGNPYYGTIHHDTYPHNWNTELRAHSGERFFCTNQNIESIGLFRALGRSEEDATGPVYIYQDVDLTGLAGTKLILSGYVGDHSYLSINLLDKNGEIVAHAGDKYREIESVPDGEWVYREHYVRVPEEAVTARVFLTAFYEYTPVGIPNTTMFDRTEGYFDDISLVADYFVEELPKDELLYNRGGETGILDEWKYDEKDLLTDFRDDFLNAETDRAENYPYDDLWEVKKIADEWCDDIEPYEGDYLITADHNRGPRGLEDHLDEPWDIALYQEVDVSAIPAGTVLDFSAYICENGWLTLEAYDAGGKLLESVGEEDEEIRHSDFDTWTKQSCQITLPKGASTLKAKLNTKYSTTPVQGGALERMAGCFDEMSLKASGWTKPDDYVGNSVTAGISKDSGSDKKDSDAADKDSDSDKKADTDKKDSGSDGSSSDKKNSGGINDTWGGNSGQKNAESGKKAEGSNTGSTDSGKKDESKKTGKYSDAILYRDADWFLNCLAAEYFPEAVLNEIETLDIQDNIEGDWLIYMQTDTGNEANSVLDPETEEYVSGFVAYHMKGNITDEGSEYTLYLELCEAFNYMTGEIDNEKATDTMKGKESEDGLVFSGEVDLEIVRVFSLNDRLYAAGTVYYPTGETLQVCMIREK